MILTTLKLRSVIAVAVSGFPTTRRTIKVRMAAGKAIRKLIRNLSFISTP